MSEPKTGLQLFLESMGNPNLAKQEKDFLIRLIEQAKSAKQNEGLLDIIARNLEVGKANSYFPRKIETPEYDLLTIRNGREYVVNGQYSEFENKMELFPARFLGAKNYEDSVSTIAHELGHWVRSGSQYPLDVPEEVDADNLGYSMINPSDSLFSNERIRIINKLLRSNLE